MSTTSSSSTSTFTSDDSDSAESFAPESPRRHLDLNWRQQGTGLLEDNRAVSASSIDAQPTTPRKSRLPKITEPGAFVLIPRRRDVAASSIIHSHSDFSACGSGTDERGFGHPALIVSISRGIATCFQVTTFGGQPRDVKYHLGEGARSRAARYIEIAGSDQHKRHSDPRDEHGIPIVRLPGLTSMISGPSYINIDSSFDIELENLHAYGNSTHSLADGELARIQAYQAKLIAKGLVERKDRIPDAQCRPCQHVRRSPHRESERLRQIQSKTSWR